MRDLTLDTIPAGPMHDTDNDNGTHFHVDTDSGGLWGWFLHGFVDVFLGNMIFDSEGIPR